MKVKAVRRKIWECKVFDGKSPGFVRIAPAAGWVEL